MSIKLITFQDDDRYEFLCNGIMSEDAVGALTLAFAMGENEMLIGLSKDKKSVTLTRYGGDGYTIVLVEGQSNSVSLRPGFNLNVQTDKIRFLSRGNKLNLLLEYSYLTSGDPIRNRLLIKGVRQDIYA